MLVIVPRVVSVQVHPAGPSLSFLRPTVPYGICVECLPEATSTTPHRTLAVEKKERGTDCAFRLSTNFAEYPGTRVPSL
eukprot:289231-Rhodomonas_salina.1